MSSEAPPVSVSLYRIVAELFPWMFFSYPRTYVVVAIYGDGSMDLVPPPDAPALPPLKAVPQWTVGGVICTPVAGTSVMVTFGDANPARPRVTSFPPGTPTNTTLDASTLGIGANATEVDIAGGSVAHVDPTGFALRWGDTITTTLGPLVLVSPTPTAPVFSKVKV